MSNTIEILKKQIIDTNDSAIKIKLLEQLIPKLLDNLPHEADSYIEQYSKLVEPVSDVFHKTRLHYYLGSRMTLKNQWGPAFLTLSQALQSVRKLNDPVLMAKIMMRLAYVEIQRGEVAEALALLKETLVIGGEQDILIEINSNNLIGMAYRRILEYEKTIPYYEQALELCRKLGDPHREALQLSNLASLYISMKRSEEGLKAIRQARPIFIKLDDTRNIVRGYSIEAGLHAAAGNYDQALERNEKALELCDEVNNTESKANLLICQAEYCVKAEHFQEGIEWSEKALNLLDSVGILKLQQKIHYYAAQSYRGAGNFESGMHHMSLFAELTDKAYYVHEARLRKEAEEVMNQYQERLKIQELEKDLELKKRELTAKAMSLARKQELMVGWQEKIQNATKTRDNSIIAACLKSLSGELKDQLKSIHVWDEFEKWFREVHGDFYRNLTGKYPSLSLREQKICAFLKLKMQTKDIASLTNLAPKTIENYRIAIRRKLKIPKGENLFYHLDLI